MRRLLSLLAGGAVAILSTSAVAAGWAALPAWLSQPIAEGKVSPKVAAINEVSYDGERMFVFQIGVEEFELFDERGKLICRVCCFASNVTYGSCTPSKIVYGRSIYPKR